MLHGLRYEVESTVWEMAAETANYGRETRLEGYWYVCHAFLCFLCTCKTLVMYIRQTI